MTRRIRRRSFSAPSHRLFLDTINPTTELDELDAQEEPELPFPVLVRDNAEGLLPEHISARVEARIGVALLIEGRDARRAIAAFKRADFDIPLALIPRVIAHLVDADEYEAAARVLVRCGDREALTALAERAVREYRTCDAIDVYALAGNAEQLRKIGEARLLAGDAAGYRAFMRLGVDPPAAAELAFAGQLLAGTYHIEKALDIYERLAAAVPRDLALAAARANLRRLDYLPALRAYSAAGENPPQDRLLDFAKRSGDISAVIDALIRADARNLLVGRGDLSRAQGQHFDAIQFYEAANARPQLRELARELSSGGRRDLWLRAMRSARAVEDLEAAAAFAAVDGDLDEARSLFTVADAIRTATSMRPSSTDAT